MSMDRNLEGIVTVISGVTLNTGREIAHRFAREGSKIVLSSDKPEALQALADEIVKAGGEALAVVADRAHFIQVKNLVTRAIEAFGKIDIMVNMTGFYSGKKFEQISPHEIDSQIDLGFRGILYGSRAVIPVMKEAGGGTIVNICALCNGMSAVCASSRRAVMEFSSLLSSELKPYGIRVSAISSDPGTVPSREHQEELQQAGQKQLLAEDLAEIAFSCTRLTKGVLIQGTALCPLHYPGENYDNQ